MDDIATLELRLEEATRNHDKLKTLLSVGRYLNAVHHVDMCKAALDKARGTATASTPFIPVCYNCKEAGHYATYCPARMDFEAERVSKEKALKELETERALTFRLREDNAKFDQWMRRTIGSLKAESWKTLRDARDSLAAEKEQTKALSEKLNEALRELETSKTYEQWLERALEKLKDEEALKEAAVNDKKVALKELAMEKARMARMLRVQGQLN
jgi:Zinc knuckle